MKQIDVSMSSPKCCECEFFNKGWCESYDVAAPLLGDCYNW